MDGRAALRCRVLAPTSAATVLVVEDDPLLRELYRQVLVAARYRPVMVVDGIDALLQIEAGTPDVVVLDLGLPRVSGWDVYRELRARVDTRRLPIIVVTGNTLRDIDPSDLAAFLTKPFKPEKLAEAVDKALGL